MQVLDYNHPFLFLIEVVVIVVCCKEDQWHKHEQWAVKKRKEREDQED